MALPAEVSPSCRSSWDPDSYPSLVSIAVVRFSVLATVLLPHKGTMTKATYKGSLLSLQFQRVSHGRERGVRKAGTALEQQPLDNLLSDPQPQDRENQLGMPWAFKTSKPTPSGRPLQTRPHPLILPKQFHLLGTKYTNV